MSYVRKIPGVVMVWEVFGVVALLGAVISPLDDVHGFWPCLGVGVVLFMYAGLRRIENAIYEARGL